MENKNYIPVVSMQSLKATSSRWVQIKSAMLEKQQQEQAKPLSQKLLEGLKLSSNYYGLYAAKGAVHAVADLATLAKDLIVSPNETLSNIAEGVKTTYKTLKESSPDQKLDWLTHKSIQAIQSTPQQQAEAVGYVAGDILIGEGLIAGVKRTTKGLSKLSKLGSVSEKARVVAAEGISAKAISHSANNISKGFSPPTFNKISEGMAKIKNEAKMGKGILEGDPKAIESSYNKLIRGSEKAVPPPKAEIIPYHNGYTVEWPKADLTK